MYNLEEEEDEKEKMLVKRKYRVIVNALLMFKEK